MSAFSKPEEQKVLAECLESASGAVICSHPRFRKSIEAIVWRELKSRDLWSDINHDLALSYVQDMFDKQPNPIGKWLRRESHDNLFAFVAVVVRNRIRSWTRTYKSAQELTELETASAYTSPIDRLCHEESLAILREGIASCGLTDDERTALLLRFSGHKNMPYKEIARRMERPVTSVNTWLHDAKSKLGKYVRSRLLHTDASDD